MSKKNRTKIGVGSVTTGNGPGSNYEEYIARVWALRGGRYELTMDADWGSDQGTYHSSSGCSEATVRADDLDTLQRDGIMVSRGSEGLNCAEMHQAIREAIYEAEDSLQTD